MSNTSHSSGHPIERAAFVGMGALGLLFGQSAVNNIGESAVTFLMDADRLARHSHDIYSINGRPVSFQMADTALAQPYDLVVVAVKYGALPAVIRQIGPAIGPDTVIISLMNGITSEDMLAEVYDRSHIIDCIAIGMDAMRDGTSLNYMNMGRLQIGVTDPSQQESYDRLVDFLTRARIPFEEVPDVRRAMWKKFMLNVGINQCCTAYETDYQHATAPGPICDEMIAAMQEVIDLADKAGISLNQQDLDECIALERTLNPTGYPSMRQDSVAKRPSELDMFAGTVIRLGKELGVPTPVNEKYRDMILEIESHY